MSFAYDVIGVGGLAYDLVLSVDQLPLADDKYPAELIGQLPGGFIANAACAAARLGLRVAYAGWVGDDAPGEMLRADFERWQVDPAGLVQVAGVPTPFTVVITDTLGQRCILLPSNPLFHRPLTSAQLDIVAQANVIYTFPRDRAWMDALHAIASVSGSTLALDVEHADQLEPDDLEHAIQQAGIVFISRASLESLGVASIAEIAAADRWVVMTDGARGAYGSAGESTVPVFCPARQVEHVVDTTGAGDAFHAAVIAARFAGADLPDALAFATAAAALKVQQRGARGGLPTRAEVDAFLADQT